jgi:hypothetical protein
MGGFWENTSPERTRSTLREITDCSPLMTDFPFNSCLVAVIVFPWFGRHFPHAEAPVGRQIAIYFVLFSVD